MAYSSSYTMMSPMTPIYRDWWDMDYPRRLLDQHFGMGLFDRDLHAPILSRGYVIRPRTQLNISSSGSSEVRNDNDKFQIMLNVKQFAHEEITLKIENNFVVIHGEHQEKQDDHGFISRKFTRRYMLPEGVVPETVTSVLNYDGVLCITGPRKELQSGPKTAIDIPVGTPQQHSAVIDSPPPL